MHEFSDLAKPLLTFGELLGILPDVWVEREELEQITYNDLHFNKDVATKLTLDQITHLRDAYGDALTCRFRLGELPVLDIGLELSEEVLKKFRDDIQNSPTIIFELTLDKRQVVNNWLENRAGYHLFLYFFSRALENFLTSDLSRLERLLWGSESETANKVVLLVSDNDILLDGSYLAVLGGAQIEHLHEVVSQQPRNADELRNMYNICQKNLNWQVPWVKHLTPLHLKLDWEMPLGGPIAKMLLIHQINSIVLYTADRTVGNKDKPMFATYVGASQSVELAFWNPEDFIEDDTLAGAKDLMEMLEWAYDLKWSNDRLPLIQIGVVQALRAVSPPFRYKLLLHNAPNIFDGLKWHWKAFIEDKVNIYVSQVHELEKYVADTVQAFADQIAAIIKSLSDTMLAAVGVILGSFIAALFKDTFNPTIFKIGMVVYACYVLIFPLFYNMLHQWERYKALLKNFNDHQKRFEERLYPDNVNKIVGTQITDSQRHFKLWFYATVVAYILVIIFALVATQLVPEFMKDTALSALSNTTLVP